MLQYNFEWSPAKERLNIEKHGVFFGEAIGVFKDPLAMTMYEEEESSPEEDRWVTVGLVNHQHYLVMVHTYEEQANSSVTIRVISARRATKHEIKQYEQR